MQSIEQRTSIRDIPLELLVFIFRWSFDINTTSFQRDRCRLSLVCRWWRDTVQGSACLWTDISAHGSESYIEKSLVKSAGLPIDVHYFSPDSPSERPDPQAHFKLVLKHLPRCRSISVFIKDPIVDDFEELFIGLRTIPAPFLESLALKGSGFQRMDDSFEWDLQLPKMTAFPALRWLEIDGISCKLAPPGLLVNDFRSLNLIDVHNIEAEQLLEALRNSPRLERLELGRSPRACPSQSAVAPIDLPHLMALHLIYTPVQVSNFFLTTIHAPNCCELFISSNFLQFPNDVVRERLFTGGTDHFSPVLQKLLTRGQYKDIGVSRPSDQIIKFYLQFHNDYSLRQGLFQLEFLSHSIGQVEETIRWLTSYLDHDVPKIPICFTLSGGGSTLLMNLIDSHMPITQLNFLCGRCDSQLIDMGKPSSSGWPLPDLEVFVYRPWDPPGWQTRKMLDMLRRRYSPSSKEADSRRALPRPLRRVRIGHCPTRTVGEYLVEEVKKILPQADTSFIDAHEDVPYW